MIAYTLGYILDLIIGDPHQWYHPVRLVGRLIQGLEKLLLKEHATRKVKKSMGFILLFCVASLGYIIPWLILYVCFKIHVVLGIAVESWMLFRAFATRQLDRETMWVYKALKAGDLKEARLKISYLVSRDTETMTEEDIIKAGIETISENMADGVVAPIFFAVIGGAPLAWLYKSVNTLDSMVGYKNDKYEDFGYASAKCDDVLNYIPARLTSLFMLLAGWFLRFDLKNGFKMTLRDRKNHASPNSAYPESSAAGLLGIQLGGRASYFGKTSEKPTMGDALKTIETHDLKKASYLLYGTSFLAWLVLGSALLVWR